MQKSKERRESLNWGEWACLYEEINKEWEAFSWKKQGKSTEAGTSRNFFFFLIRTVNKPLGIEESES